MRVPHVAHEEIIEMDYALTPVCDNIRLQYFRRIVSQIAHFLSQKIQRGRILKGYKGTVQAESSYTTGDDLLGRLNSIEYPLPEDPYDKIDPTLVCGDCKCDKG